MSRGAADVELRRLAAALHPRIGYFAYLFRRVGGTDFGVIQSAVFGQLYERSPQRVSQLAQAERVRLPTMTETVNRLQSQGWVAKQADPADARCVLVSLTDKGRRLMVSTTSKRTRYTRELLLGLPEEDRRALAAVLPVLDRLFAEPEAPPSRPPAPAGRLPRERGG
jgi:DNA-binding MarR family transcriptional regulator